ncbi:MAG: two-component system nitrate/nitrite sensor histidine kinase NarX [Gammaproteobacteria bacterium]|jgi:two-component system nitrate/nitrite sensor histidine kinase NarX
MPTSETEHLSITPVNSGRELQFDRIIRCMARCRILASTALLFASLISFIFIVYRASIDGDHNHSWFFFALPLLCLSFLGLTIRLLWNDYVKPLLNIENWIQKMRSGELTSKVPIPPNGQITELAADLNDFGTMMNNLSRDTEHQLQKFTEYTEQKTLSLTILYDVAATINRSQNLSDLLEKFLKTLTSVIGAESGAVRLLNTSNQMELVSSIGFDEEMKVLERYIPANECVCSLKNNFDGFIYQDSLLPCQTRQHHSFFAQKDVGLIVVPLQYQDQTLGVFNLFIANQNYRDTGDYRELFTSIGKHLGMAIAKARLDEESHKLSIMQERNRLSYELHDSLAQTLTSIRFQVRVLDEMMYLDDEKVRWQQLERIENTIEEANTELRSLIAHFQAPISQQPLIDKIKDLVKHFRTECSIPIFFQYTIDKKLLFSDRVNIEVSRIIQEALNNIKKHSNAKVARIMIRERDTGQINILVEDDGQGLPAETQPSKPGEQIGLKSMKERASRIKAEFILESEPGEGTRLLLDINPDVPMPEDVISLKPALSS